MVSTRAALNDLGKPCAVNDKKFNRRSAQINADGRLDLCLSAPICGFILRIWLQEEMLAGLDSEHDPNGLLSNSLRLWHGFRAAAIIAAAFARSVLDRRFTTEPRASH